MHVQIRHGHMESHAPGMPSSDDPVSPARLSSRRRDTVLGAAGRMLWERDRSIDPGVAPSGVPASAPCSDRRMLYGSGPRPAQSTGDSAHDWAAAWSWQDVAPFQQPKVKLSVLPPADRAEGFTTKQEGVTMQMGYAMETAVAV